MPNVPLPRVMSFVRCPPSYVAAIVMPSIFQLSHMGRSPAHLCNTETSLDFASDSMGYSCISRRPPAKLSSAPVFWVGLSRRIYPVSLSSLESSSNMASHS